jgi:hypothetical protein
MECKRGQTCALDGGLEFSVCDINRLLLGATSGPNVTNAQGSALASNASHWYDARSGHDLHVVVRMNFAVTYISADLIHHWFDVCVQVPPVDSCEGREA